MADLNTGRPPTGMPEVACPRYRKAAPGDPADRRRPWLRPFGDAGEDRGDRARDRGAEVQRRGQRHVGVEYTFIGTALRAVPASSRPPSLGPAVTALQQAHAASDGQPAQAAGSGHPKPRKTTPQTAWMTNCHSRRPHRKPALPRMTICHSQHTRPVRLQGAIRHP